MGAWGHGNFENDDALDWAATLVDADDLSSIEQLLLKIVELHGYLEAPDCSEALAAAEVVAAMLTPAENRGNLPEECLEFIDQCPDPVKDELRLLALAAVSKITSSSELKELWSESDSMDNWIAVQQRLIARLSL